MVTGFLKILQSSHSKKRQLKIQITKGARVNLGPKKPIPQIVAGIKATTTMNIIFGTVTGLFKCGAGVWKKRSSSILFPSFLCPKKNLSLCNFNVMGYRYPGGAYVRTTPTLNAIKSSLFFCFLKITILSISK